MGSVVGLLERMVDRILALESSLFWGGVFAWLALALIVAGVASGRGQSSFGFFVLALILSSVVAMLVLLATPNTRQRRLAAYEARVMALEAHLGVSAPVDPTVPMLPSAGSAPLKGPHPALTWALIIALILIGVVGGVAQLGSSANATFTTIDGETFTAPPPPGYGR